MTKLLTQPNWKTFNDGECHYDSDRFLYVVVLETEETDIPTEVWLQSLADSLKDTAVSKLISYYKRNLTEENKENVKTSIYLDDFYLEERPGAYLKLKFAVEQDIWLGIEDAVTVQNAPEIKFMLQLTSSDIYQRFEAVSKHLRSIQTKITESKADLRPFDVVKESKLLEQFPTALNSLLTINNLKIRKDEDDDIILDLDPEYKLVDVTVIQGFEQEKLKKGISVWSEKEPFSEPRTMHYASKIDEMYNEIKTKVDPEGWYQFLDKYTLDLPDWSPSNQDKNKESEKNFESSKFDITAPYKTAKQKIEEIDKLTSEFKTDLIKSIKNSQTFVGDGQLSERLKNSTINSLDDVYSQILNKISLDNLLSKIANNIMSCLPISDAIEAWQTGNLMSLDLKTLQILIESVFTPNEIQEQELVVSTNPCGSKFVERTQKEKYVSSIVDKLQGALPTEVLDQIGQFIPGIEQLGKKALATFEEYVEDADALFEKESTNLLNTALPKPPTLDFPENLPVLDLLESLPKQIEKAINEAVEQIIVQVVRNLSDLFEQITDFGPNCRDKKDPNKYGTVNSDNLIESSNQFPLILSAMDKFGISVDQISDFQLEDDETGELNPEEVVSEFLTSITSILTQQEVCKLFQGQASTQSLKVIKLHLQRYYPQLLDNFRTLSELSSFFESISIHLDLSFCYIDFGPPEKRFEDPCDPEPTLPNDMLTSQRHQDLEENKKRLQELAEMLAKDNPFDDLVPPMNCEPGLGNSMALAARNDPTVEFLSKLTFESFFSALIMSFNAELSGFTSYLLEPVTVDENDNIVSSQESANSLTSTLTTKTRILPGLIGDLRDANNFQWNQKNGKNGLAAFNLSQGEGKVNIEQTLIGIVTLGESGNEEDGSSNQLSEDELEDEVFFDGSGKGIDSVIINSNKLSTPIFVSNEIKDTPWFEEYVQKTSLYEHLNMPQKALAFVNLVKEKFLDMAKVVETDKLKTFLTFVSDQYYYQLFSVLLSQYAHSVSYSKFFDKPSLLDLELVPLSSNPKKGKPIDCSVSPPIIQPYPLIDISDVTDKAFERNKELQCQKCSNELPDSFQKSLLESSIDLTYRLFVIENALSDIFTFSTFGIDKINNSQIPIEIIFNQFQTSLNKRGYLQSFLDESLNYVRNQIDPSIGNGNAAARLLIQRQIESVKDAMNGILSGRVSDDPPSILDDCPILDVPLKVTDTRFSNINNINLTNENDRFKLKNLRDKGGFVVERYVRVDSNFLPVNNGVQPLNVIQNMVNNHEVANDAELYSMADTFNYGLRISLMVPYSIENTVALGSDAGPSKGPQLNLSQVLNEKKFILIEGNNVNTTSWSKYIQSAGVYKARLIPLIEVEIPEENITFSKFSEESIFERFPTEQLKKLVKNDKAYDVLNYSYSDQEMVQLIGLYNRLALLNILDFETIFDETKGSLKSLFLTAKNGDNYQHQSNPDGVNPVDDFQNNFKTQFGVANGSNPLKDKGKTSGFALAMALKTPIWIFKGLAENMDPAIMLSEKIRKAANLPEIALPGIAIPLGLNPFTPLTPIGSAYLGLAFLDLDESSSSTKDLDQLKEEQKEKECKDS